MKNYQTIIIVFILFINNCMAQTGAEKLFGTWVETHRDYVYFKTNMAYEFTKAETDIFKGSQIVFAKDTLFAYVTYLSENTMYPISYEIRDIKTDTVNQYRGNLSELLLKKGKNCKEITVKKKGFNGSQEYYAEYGFYLFDDGSLAQLRDYSLHYYNKISPENIGGWKKNEFGQTIVCGFYSGRLSIENIPNKSFIQVSYFPAKTGKNNCRIEYINKIDNIRGLIFDQENELNKEMVSVFFKNRDSIKKFKLFVGASRNPIDSQWEVRYKFIDNAGKIQIPKSLIFSAPETPTKMYLLKGDDVEILAEKREWLNIRYYGKKTIEGWVKKEDVK